LGHLNESESIFDEILAYDDVLNNVIAHEDIYYDISNLYHDLGNNSTLK
jgi:hypothetical protein